MKMRARQWMTGSAAVLALAALVASCGGTGGGGGSKGNTGQQFIRNSNNAGRLTLTANPNEVDANKSDRIGLTAILTDSTGRGVQGATITFSTDLNENDIIRDLGDVTFIPGVGPENLTGTAVTDANGRADIIAVAGSAPSATGEFLGTGAFFAEAPQAFQLRAQVQVSVFDVGFIDATALGVIPTQIDLGNPAFGSVLFFTVVGGTPPYLLSNPVSGIGTGSFSQSCLPGCTENGGILCIGSPCLQDSDCNANASPTPAGVCLGPIKRCIASCRGTNCGGARCEVDADCNDGSASPANVCKDSGQNLSYTVTVGCGNGRVESTAGGDGATHLFNVSDTTGTAVNVTVVVTLDEQCDGNDFGSNSCQSQGFQSGSLACTAGCTLDTSGCSNATPAAGATFTPGGGVATPTPTVTAGGGGGTPTPAGTPGVGIPSNLALALLTNGSGDNNNGTLTTVISATVTDVNGNPVPDGSQVLFSLSGATNGAIISSPSSTNAAPPCDVSNFQSATGITVLNQPGVANTCVTYPTGSAGSQITVNGVSGAANASSAFTLPPPPP